MKFQTPRGTRDFLPQEMIRLDYVMSTFKRIFEKYGFENFERECRRMYEQTSILIKLEENFGFYGERPQKRKTLPADKLYIPRRWLCDQSQTDFQFVCNAMAKKDTLYGNMKPIFRIFQWLSVVLMIIIAVLIKLHIHGYF